MTYSATMLSSLQQLNKQSCHSAYTYINSKWMNGYQLSASIDPHPWWAHWCLIFIHSICSIYEVWNVHNFLFRKKKCIQVLDNLNFTIFSSILRELILTKQGMKREVCEHFFSSLSAWEQYAHTHTRGKRRKYYQPYSLTTVKKRKKKNWISIIPQIWKLTLKIKLQSHKTKWEYSEERMLAAIVCGDDHGK